MNTPTEAADAPAPACVGVVMDGNRRWARAHNLPVFEGHNEGRKKLQECVRWAREAGIEHVVAYVFSTENWKRPEKEVGYLMKLFRSVLENETQKMVEERIRVRFLGDRARFDTDIQEMMARMEQATQVSYDITLHLAMSYGGRAEIIAATNLLLKEGKKIVAEKEFSQKMWSYPMPDPDLIIRTGGEKRLSGFLSWQSVYSELFFFDSLWPAFTKEEFERCLAEYQERRRNFGV